MKIFRFVVLILYNIFILLYFKKLLLPKRSQMAFYIAPIIINIAIAIPSYFLVDERILFYPLMVAMIIIVKFLLYCNWIQVIFVGLFYIFTLYSSLGVIFSLHSLVLNQSISQVLHLDVNELIFTQAVMLSIFLIIIFRKVVVIDKRAKRLFHNKGQLKFIVGYLFIQLTYLTLINDGLFREVNQNWYSYLYFVSCATSKLWLVFVINHTAKVTDLIDYELHSQQLNKQLCRQISHYHSYQRFISSFKVFRHDYEKLMNTIRTLLKKQEYVKAQHMLNKIESTMQEEILIHKTYSNNILLDAILLDAANLCVEKDIRFLGYIHICENLNIEELDIVRIFSNAIENAIEACTKITDSKRFIEIKGKQTDVWQIVEIENTFCGELIMINGIPQTTKINKDYHGLGYNIIKTAVEELGGQVYIGQDQLKGIFKLKLCIPKLLNNN